MYFRQHATSHAGDDDGKLQIMVSKMPAFDGAARLRKSRPIHEKGVAHCGKGREENP